MTSGASAVATAPADDVILEVRNLETHIQSKRGVGKAVDKVSFTISAGRTLALVGESGSGKSITAASLLRIHPQPASRIVGGEVLLRGVNLLALSEKEMNSIRGQRIGYVPQEPHSSLDPLFTIGSQIGEALRIHLGMRGEARHQRTIELIERVGVPLARERARAYPHELSGGMRQRILSAIAISCDPEMLIADEPTTALDVTIQAEYLELLADIQAERGLGILFITHDFGIVANMSDDVAVMYAGKIVERAPTVRLFDEPAHPYTRALIGSLPDVSRPRSIRLPAIAGQPPSIFAQPPGCSFAPRCPLVMEKCSQTPPWVEVSLGHGAACWKLT